MTTLLSAEINTGQRNRASKLEPNTGKKLLVIEGITVILKRRRKDS